MARKKHDGEPAEPVTQGDIQNKGETKAKPKKGNPNWRKGGPSPHPGGRPKQRWELVEKIQARGEELVNALFDIVDECPKEKPTGNERGPQYEIVGPTHRERIEAAKTLIAYGYGKPTETVEMSGPGGQPIQTQTGPQLEKMTTGELRKRLAELRKANETPEE